jgi:SAM-dependent methyltransferase
MESHRYDDVFFDYVDVGAYRSARQVLPVLQQYVRVSSILDVGCGRGVWLAVWNALGIADFLGVDGEYVDTGRLAIPSNRFVARDVSARFSLDRKFDLVQCLEVAEHIPEYRADILVENLIRHGDMVLFSAAIPGQGGESHINEQPYEYWHEKFDRQGYRPFDFLRPVIRALRNVQPWYRFNTFMFVNETGIARLSQEAARTEIGSNTRIKDYASRGWKLRTQILRHMPRGLVNYLSYIRHLISYYTRADRRSRF